tara:strand:- start:161 stop:475 length:315 start_codon:yes stop_codon:yes gene_type:complete
MDIYNNLVDVYNSNSKKIIETFQDKKNDTEKNIGSMSIENFYFTISLLIIAAIIIPLLFIYIYESDYLNSIFNLETVEHESEMEIDNLIETENEVLNELNTRTI